jgi:hypothetical protein
MGLALPPCGSVIRYRNGSYTGCLSEWPIIWTGDLSGRMPASYLINHGPRPCPRRTAVDRCPDMEHVGNNAGAIQAHGFTMPDGPFKNLLCPVHFLRSSSPLVFAKCSIIGSLSSFSEEEVVP